MREHAADVASTGNHGQSIAYAAGLHGLRAVVFVPEGANPDKIASMRRLGAEVREEGERFAEANAAALEFAAEHAMRYVAVDEPLLLSGVATAALEVLDEDRGMIASLQRNMQSRIYQPGSMSKLETGIHHVITDFVERLFGENP